MKNNATLLTQLVLIKLLFTKTSSFCGNRVKNVYLKTFLELNFKYGNY